MRIRHLRIRMVTQDGLYGADIPFEDGLCVLRADNSMGKSTCIRSMLVALGLEAMLTTNQHDLPLPPVMKAKLMSDEEELAVLESEVFLEIENGAKERIVIQRTIKGERNSDLVRVTFGPALTDSAEVYQSEDFFLRHRSSQSERGFHRFLSDFLHWNLPMVHTYENNEYPLYPQLLFPYFAVEQTRGWSNLEPVLPTQFQIREPRKRAVEFLLCFDAIEIAANRLELAAREVELRAKWAAAVQGLKSITSSVGGVLERAPVNPTTHWPPELPPVVSMSSGHEDWISLERMIHAQKEELNHLITEEIPRVSEVSEEVEADLNGVQDQLRRRESVVARILEELIADRGEMNSAQTRLIAIQDDLARHKDLRKLEALGARMVPALARQECPTCHQHVQDSLLPLAEDQEPMSIEDNISFLEEQRRLFRGVLATAKDTVGVREQQVEQMRKELSAQRRRIRVLRETLVQDGRVPSREAIQKQVELREGIDRLESGLERFREGLDDIGELAAIWSEIKSDQSEIPARDASVQDREKVSRWGQILREQLEGYGFQSLKISEINIAPETYRPTHDGFDLPSNISASDFVRTIWAYLHGMLELSREFPSNHPGFLIFDEPRQQSAKELSFKQLLLRASTAKEHGQQVIFATSENTENLKRMLAGVPHSFLGFDGHIIRKISI